MHHHFASQFLIDSLHEHGYSCSYAEVLRYERNAAVRQGTEIPVLEQEQGQHVQYVADNVAHNIATIEGNGTFHAMGIIAAITPRVKTQRRLIPKLKVTAEELATVGCINIEYFRSPQAVTPPMYHPLQDMRVKDGTSELDVLWKTSMLFHPKRPGWSGLMQMLHNGQYPGESSVIFLPMIDLNPSDPSCIYSTIKFVSCQARKYNATPVLTFDQPLYWKAMMILNSLEANSC